MPATELTRRVGTEFQFDVPLDWTEGRRGAQFFFQAPGPDLQELIVQGRFLEGTASPVEEAKFLDATVSDMLASLGGVLDAPELRGGRVRALGPDPTLPVQPAWSGQAVSNEDGTLFCGAVFRGALLYTFEATNESEGLSTYHRLVQTVRRVGDQGTA